VWVMSSLMSNEAGDGRLTSPAHSFCFFCHAVMSHLFRIALRLLVGWGVEEGNMYVGKVLFGYGSLLETGGS
jgi:hypothetical protein